MTQWVAVVGVNVVVTGCSSQQIRFTFEVENVTLEEQGQSNLVENHASGREPKEMWTSPHDLTVVPLFGEK